MVAVVRGLGAGREVGSWGVVREVLGAVNEGAAVRALGYDNLLSAVGAGVWVLRVGGWGEERWRLIFLKARERGVRKGGGFR